MGSENRTWGAHLRTDQHQELSEIIDEAGMTKSEAIKRSVDAYLDQRDEDEQPASQLTPFEDAALDAAVFSALGAIGVASSVALNLVGVAFLQLGAVFLTIAIVAVVVVQQGVLGGIGQ